MVLNGALRFYTRILADLEQRWAHTAAPFCSVFGSVSCFLPWRVSVVGALLAALFVRGSLSTKVHTVLTSQKLSREQKQQAGLPMPKVMEVRGGETSYIGLRVFFPHMQKTGQVWGVREAQLDFLPAD